MQYVLTTPLLLEAYKQGLFPMAYNASSPFIQWVCPEMRGQLDIETIHIPRSLKKIINKMIRSDNIKIQINTAFEDVIGLCGEPHNTRPETWINGQIKNAFIDLHHKGYAHSVEYWEDGELRGGLYGLAIGSAFFGESMFSRTPNASKISLIHLCARLWRGGFTVLDTQFTNDHLEQFGITEIPHENYLDKLNIAIHKNADFKLEDQCQNDIIKHYFEMRGYL